MATDPDDQSTAPVYGDLNVAALDDRETLLVTAQRLAELTWFTAPAENGAKNVDQQVIHRLRRIASGLLDEPQPTPTIFDTQGVMFDVLGLEPEYPAARRHPRLHQTRQWLGGIIHAIGARVEGRGR